MKLKKALISAAAISASAAIFSLGASAYDLDKDFRTGWSISVTVPASEFEELTKDSVVTITYTADASLADVEGQDYWCIKPMINDAGWPFIDSLVGSGITLSEGGDSYSVTVDATEIKFSVPDEETVEHIKTAGLAFMGHGIAVGSLTVSNSETLPEPAPAAPAETAAAAPAPAAGDVAAASDSSKGSPDTGIADVAAVAGLAIVAGGAALIAKKSK